MMRTWLVMAVLVAACNKEGAKEGSKEGAEKANPRDGVIAAWKKAGLEPSAFTPATTPVGKDCTSGTVNKLDVLVCVFASEQEAKAAEDGGLGWVGDATGASRARGSVLIAVADRRKVDPSGRTINQLVTPPAK